MNNQGKMFYYKNFVRTHVLQGNMFEQHDPIVPISIPSLRLL